MADNRTQLIISAKDETSQAFRSVKGSLDSLTKAGSALGLYLGIDQVTEFIKASSRAAMEAEQASARIFATLKATGYSAGVAKVEIDAMADALARTTQFDDEAIRNAAAAFLKFGNIQAGVFQEGIKLSADLAAFLGTDVADAAQTVGKALSSPSEGIGALERQIGKLTEAQKQYIKAAVESGNSTDAQQKVLDILQGKIGGTAELMNTGLTRATNDAAKAWDEFLESIGKTPAIQVPVISSLDLLTTTLRGFDLDKWIAIGQAQNKKPTGWITDESGRTTFNAGDIGRIGEKDIALTGQARANRDRIADENAAKAAKELADAQEKARKSAEANFKSAQQFVESLKKQAETLGLTKDELLRYDAAHAGLNQKQLEAANASIAKIAAFEKEKAANEALADAVRQLNDEEDRRLGRAREVQDDVTAETIEKLKHAKDLSEGLAAQMQTPMDKLNESMTQINYAWSNGVIDNETWQNATAAAQAAAGGIDEINQNLVESNSLSKDLGLTFTSAFEDAIVGGKEFSDVLQGLGDDIERILVRRTITEPLDRGITGLLNSSGISSGVDDLFSGIFGGFRAAGGPVNVGKAYVVGERGPELFMPNSSGSIVPNGAGGGDVVVNLIEAPGKGGQVSRSSDNNGNMTIDIMVEMITQRQARDIGKGDGLSRVLENTYGLNRAYGAVR